MDPRRKLRAILEAREAIAGALIAELGARREDPVDRVAYLLRNCGFLAERSGDRVVLSDNAHRQDSHYISDYLPAGPEALETFPWIQMFARWRSGGADYPNWPDRFVQRVHGFKIPAGCLDGLVAYLVKALGAVGVLTTWSCDGHNDRPLRVWLERGCSSAWATMVIGYVERERGLIQNWRVGNGILNIQLDRERDWTRYYLEALDVADFLYRERIRLRGIRSEMIRQLDERAEEFEYPSLLLHMDHLLRDTLSGVQKPAESTD